MKTRLMSIKQIDVLLKNGEHWQDLESDALQNDDLAERQSTEKS